MYTLMEIVLIFNLYLNIQWSKDGKSGIHKHRWEKNRKLDMPGLELTFLKFSVLYEVSIPIPLKISRYLWLSGTSHSVKTCVPIMSMSRQKTHWKSLNGQSITWILTYNDLCSPALQAITNKHLVYLQINAWICKLHLS